MFIELHLLKDCTVNGQSVCVNTDRIEKITPRYVEKEEEYIEDRNSVFAYKTTRRVWAEEGTFVIFSMEVDDYVTVKENYEEILKLLEVKRCSEQTN